MADLVKKKLTGGGSSLSYDSRQPLPLKHPPIATGVKFPGPANPFTRLLKHGYRLGRGKHMTIAAGFHVQDGILLAADTLYTGGTKVHQPKLFGYTLNENTPDVCYIAFALAGHENFGKMAIDDCVDELRSCSPQNRSLPEIRKSFRKAVKAINDAYVDTRPGAEKESAKFDLIIAGWFPRAGGLKMFKSSGPAVLSAGDYHCTGIGAYLGDYLMRNVFSSSMKLKDAALLAIQAFAAAKTYDSNCGGDTQFMTVSKSGSLSDVVPYDIHTSESYIAEFEEASRKLLFALGDPELDDDIFRLRSAEFTVEIDRIRAFWRNQGDDYLAKMMRIFNEVAQRSPEGPAYDPQF